MKTIVKGSDLDNKRWLGYCNRCCGIYEAERDEIISIAKDNMMKCPNKNCGDLVLFHREDSAPYKLIEDFIKRGKERGKP